MNIKIILGFVKIKVCGGGGLIGIINEGRLVIKGFRSE